MALLLMVLASVGSAWYLGMTAFHSGMPVRRWICAGFLMGPAAYPLFSTHKHLAERKRLLGETAEILL
ncbi:hypothetical protein [Shewanella sedimentimangrovi]|uniref:Uncharacterized protein n=1 Tax=Shewanella sedimentimangrovi TaxID=2814293 RepID=A0ABX7QWR6_9GAMM|nr:hypothetical protein [Shewanella sedimentimangrovi]QSX35954.1 hypothetical protein JYB85_11385 [Shewanella sedimentimangrovi]